jgi:hypothetical protein
VKPRERMSSTSVDMSDSVWNVCIKSRRVHILPRGASPVKVNQPAESIVFKHAI